MDQHIARGQKTASEPIYVEAWEKGNIGNAVKQMPVEAFETGTFVGIGKR